MKRCVLHERFQRFLKVTDRHTCWQQLTQWHSVRWQKIWTLSSTIVWASDLASVTSQVLRFSQQCWWQINTSYLLLQRGTIHNKSQSVAASSVEQYGISSRFSVFWESAKWRWIFGFWCFRTTSWPLTAWPSNMQLNNEGNKYHQTHRVYITYFILATSLDRIQLSSGQ